MLNDYQCLKCKKVFERWSKTKRIPSPCCKGYVAEKIISGGLLADLGDIVVDDINKPKFVYGISNGNGDFIRNLNKKQKNNIKKISKLLF